MQGRDCGGCASTLALGYPSAIGKAPMGLATPEIFKALDLSTCSKADPRQLLQQMTGAASMTQDMCVNDLERPAFDRYECTSVGPCHAICLPRDLWNSFPYQCSQ